MPDNKQYDVLIIGAGPAGYTAAIRCAQLGLSVAVVEKWLGRQSKPVLGGTCLNVGCIPSKALLDSSERYHEISHTASVHGINTDKVTMDLQTMLARKDRIVRQLTDGIAGLFKANGIDWIQGHGTLLADKKVMVTTHAGDQTEYSGRSVILASGSVPVNIPAVPVDNKQIVDSSGALEFADIPKRLIVIGAGVIGLELGSVWNRLGSEVIVLEAQDNFLPMADQQLGREALKQLKSQGLDIRLSAQVTACKTTKTAITLTYQDPEGQQKLRADRVLVAVGRCPNTQGLIDESVELKRDAKGFINIDHNFMTTIADVYAIGDCVQGPMLAHKGSEEGIAVAEIITGQSTRVDHNLIPWVIYTEPEIAWVGISEQTAKQSKVDYKKGLFPYAAAGRALAVNAPAGFAKVIAEADTDRVTGVHIIGRSASELIGEAVTVMAFQGSAEDIARTIHAHPTLSETLHEAALDVAGLAIHKAGRKRPQANRR